MNLRRINRFRPSFDHLETRTTPATLTVLNSLDSGANSLRDAIAHATNGDNIVFAPAVHNITLTSGELVINTSLNLAGPGANRLSISGNDASRVFHIAGSANATISGLTVTHGLSQGTIDALASGGYTAGGGGGIYNEAAATLHLVNVSVTNNEATHGPSADAFSVFGGGLLNLGTAFVTNCNFTGNKAVGGNGLDNLGGSCGGGIDNFGGPTGGASLTVANTIFCSNTTIAPAGFWAIGAGIEMNGGLNAYDPTLSQSSTAVFTNSSILNGLSTGGLNTAGQGGGVCSEGVGLTITLTGCTVAGNRAVGGDYAPGPRFSDSEGQGGGLLNAFGTMNVNNCLITDNHAIAGNQADTTPSPFLAAALGGGILNNAFGTVNVTNSVICGNTAEAGSGIVGRGGFATGGGVADTVNATLNMTNCIVSGNTAIGGKGIGVAGGFAFGGGIDISNLASTAAIVGSVITGNRAIGGAGGNGQLAGNGYGGGIGIGWGNLVGLNPDASQLNLTNSALLGNQAIGGAGGVGANGGDGKGGGIFVYSLPSDPTPASVSLNNSVIAGNSATGGARGAGGARGRGIGGGAYSENAQFIRTLTSIFANHASTSDDNLFVL